MLLRSTTEWLTVDGLVRRLGDRVPTIEAPVYAYRHELDDAETLAFGQDVAGGARPTGQTRRVRDRNAIVDIQRNPATQHW